jgi:hypothetical protein
VTFFVAGVIVDDPEAETGVEGCRLLDIRRMHLVVIEAKRAGAAKAFKSLIDSFESWHGRAELQGRSEQVKGMKRSALIRSLDELGLQPLSFEVGFRSIKVLIIKRPKAGPDRSWRAVGTLQHQAVVRPFFDTSQILPRQQRRSYTNPKRERGIRCVSLAGASG